MTSQKLTSFEKTVLAGLADKAGLAAAVLDAWARLPADSVQSVRSLIDAAQLGVTEEGATQALLECSIDLGLVDSVNARFKPRRGMHDRFPRLAFAFSVIDCYRTSIHRDATHAQVVLTKPPKPSILEQKLFELGWRTAALEPTDRAFHGMVRAAQRRVVIMTPFFDPKGAVWLKDILSLISKGVEATLILRSLDSPFRGDYPAGFDAIAPWLRSENVSVFNYSIPRPTVGRETFHAKVVLCDRSHAYLGSSNLTSASLEYSMEMGVVLKGKAAADVAEVVDAVLAASERFI